MDTFSVDGKTARLHRTGSGRPLVYFHSVFGEVGSLEMFEALGSDGFEVFAPELPGFGRSDPAPEWRRTEDVVFYLRRTLDVLGLDSAVIAGSSLGGWLAAEVAAWFPERVDALVLLDAFGLRVEGSPIFEIFGSAHREVWARALPHGSDMLAFLKPAIEGDESPDAVRLHLFNAMEAAARIGWNPYMHDPRLRPRLPLVTAPTLVVWGADDGIVEVEHGTVYASSIPGARLEVIEGCGHLPALEKPDAVSTMIREFVTAEMER